MQINQEAAVPEWTLGDRLKKAREHAKLSQGELADRIGISMSSVSRYEIDKTLPGRPVVLSWALCTGTDLDWLMTGGEIIVRCSRPPLPALASRWELAA